MPKLWLWAHAGESKEEREKTEIKRVQSNTATEGDGGETSNKYHSFTLPSLGDSCSHAAFCTDGKRVQ